MESECRVSSTNRIVAVRNPDGTEASGQLSDDGHNWSGKVSSAVEIPTVSSLYGIRLIIDDSVIKWFEDASSGVSENCHKAAIRIDHNGDFVEMSYAEFLERVGLPKI